MNRPSLKFIVHRYYAMMYLLAALIIFGVLEQTPDLSVPRLALCAALVIILVIAHWVQVAVITPQTIAEHSDEE